MCGSQDSIVKGVMSVMHCAQSCCVRSQHQCRFVLLTRSGTVARDGEVSALREIASDVENADADNVRAP